jgi:hypothetical protein
MGCVHGGRLRLAELLFEELRFGDALSLVVSLLFMDRLLYCCRASRITVRHE